MNHVCRDHPRIPVTWRGRGCMPCAADDEQRRDRRQTRRATRQAARQSEDDRARNQLINWSVV